MTEAEWLACTDLSEMIHLLIRRARSARSSLPSRKFRLFGCAVCRQAWDRFPDERCRAAVEMSEQFADGLANRSQLGRAHRGAGDVYAALRRASRRAPLASLASGMAMWASCDSIQDVPAVTRFAVTSAVTLAGAAGPAGKRADLKSQQARWQIELFRYLFGNPFRPPKPLPRAVLAWNDGTVRRIAEGIYEERQLPAGTPDVARLAVLADALLDAGCEDEELIAHCRSTGPHVRGYWAVDWILGKS